MKTTKERILCMVTSDKKNNKLWLKCLTDITVLFGFDFLVEGGYLTGQEAGKAKTIIMTVSWIFLFIIFYYDKKFRKRWLCIQRTIDDFTKKTNAKL